MRRPHPAVIAVVICAGAVAAHAATGLWSENYKVPGPATPAPAINGCPKGMALEVLDAGKWYAARVLEGPDSMGLCLVAYDGYGSDQNEWVNASRMRPGKGKPAPAAASPRAPAAKAPAQKAPAPGKAPEASSMPAGNYPCYAWNGTSMDYTYTDLRIDAGGRYAVGGEGGTYSRSGERVRFSGPLANATGKYSVANDGTPQVELVFSSGAWAAMTCSRS